MDKNTKNSLEKINKILKNKNKSYFVVFDLGFSNHKIEEIKPGTTFIEFLQKKYPRGFEFRPEYFLNNSKIEISDFDKKIKKGDVFFVFPSINGPVGKIVASLVINIVIQVVVAFLMKAIAPSPKSKSDNQRSYPSLYNSNVSQIEAKKGGPVPYVSGVIRMYPQLIAPVFTTISRTGNPINETTFLLCCLGDGDIDVIQLYVNNSQMEAL